MKILLTGSNGICGKYLLPFLIDNPDVTEIIGVSRFARYSYEDHPEKGLKKYIEIEGHLEHSINTFRLVSQVRPNIIINFAGISTSSSPALDVWNNNTKITLNLLESCKSLNHEVKFLQASSLSVENLPLNVYAASKIACENLVESYNQIYPELIQGISIRWPAVVGKGNKHGLLADIVNKLKADGDTITLFGEQPGSRKPFIYAKNLVDNINYLMFAEPKFWNWKNFKICPTDSLTVERVVNIVMNYIGIRKQIIWDKSKVWPEDQPVVFPAQKGNFFDKLVLSSEKAIIYALEDILK